MKGTNYNPFVNEHFIGFINQVTPQGVKVHFPSSALLQPFFKYGELYHGGLVGNYVTRVRDNILKSKEQKTIQPTKGGHKMVTYQNYVSLFYCQITSCPSDGGIS